MLGRDSSAQTTDSGKLTLDYAVLYPPTLEQWDCYLSIHNLKYIKLLSIFELNSETGNDGVLIMVDNL